MIESIKRDGTKVLIKLNLGLGIAKPVLQFEITF